MKRGKIEFASGSDSQQARAIIERGLLSPLLNDKMPNLNHFPNNAVRAMARDSAAALNHCKLVSGVVHHDIG